MKGLFITIEGVEGCGKSTQIEHICSYLEGIGRRVVRTREPGGTPISESIRALLLEPSNSAMSPVAELLLYEAARAQHVDELIRPALEAGMTVVCDRFADSTTAYQGAGRVLSGELVRGLHSVAAGEAWPDLTIVIDVPAEVGLERATRGGARDRIEREPIEFHERVRLGFLSIAQAEPERVKVVDGTRPVDEVTREILALIDARLSGHEL